MNTSLTINILKDTATPMLDKLSRIASHPEVRSEMASRCVELTANHIRGLGTNKQGWPSTGFYRAVAGNVTSETRSGGFSVLVDHPEKPGAFRQRYHGGTIHMKDKLLTIPARAEAYGHRAGDFSDLRFVAFASGSKALVTSGKKGGLVMFWLKESVTQEADPGVIPAQEQYGNQCKNVLMSAVEQIKAGGLS